MFFSKIIPTGIAGAMIRIDEFGDSEGNFSVLALKNDPYTEGNFSCDYQMKPVAHFQMRQLQHKNDSDQKRNDEIPVSESSLF